MAAAVLVVDCGSALGTQRILSLVDGLHVEAIDSCQDLRERLDGFKTQDP